MVVSEGVFFMALGVRAYVKPEKRLKFYRICSGRTIAVKVRMERRGKSSPTPMVTWVCCKPYPEQHRIRNGRKAAPVRRIFVGGMSVPATVRRDRWTQESPFRGLFTEPGLRFGLAEYGQAARWRGLFCFLARIPLTLPETRGIIIAQSVIGFAHLYTG